LAGLARHDALPGLWVDEATHIHQVARQCGGMAARSAGAAGGDARYRMAQRKEAAP